MEVLTRKALSFLLEFIYETGEKVFCLSLALLYLVDLFISKLKTKLNNLFYRMILNTKEFTTPFEETSPQELKNAFKCFICRQAKRRRRPFGHRAPKL